MVSDRGRGERGADEAWPPEKRLFRDDRDYWGFLDRLAARVEQFHIRLYLFTCMTNHVHLVFETPEANCSRFMQSLSTAYTVYYNVRHGRHGHLLDGRYKARLVDGNKYLLALSRYVHLNPVHVNGWQTKSIDEKIERLHACRWSSYPSYVGIRKMLEFVEYAPLLSLMSGRKRDWPTHYAEYVEAGLAESDEDFIAALHRSRHSIGSDDFRAGIDERYRERLAACARPEDASFRKTREPLARDDVLGVLCDVFDVEPDAFRQRRRSLPLRAIAARCLISYAGMSQRDVASFLNVGSGAAICNQLTRLPSKLAEDPRLRRRLERVKTRLRKLYAQHTRRC